MLEEPNERTSAEDGLRGRAVERLRKRSEFAAHALVYLLVNGFVLAIWAMTGAGFFWPVFPIAGWGIGLVMHAWDVYRRGPSEARIREEIERLRTNA